MEIQVILSFSVYAIINAFTPGPGNLLALNTMSIHGWKKGKKLFLGIFVGYYVVQAICAVSIFSLNQFLNPIMETLKYVGAAYIIWLAIHIIRSSPTSTKSKNKLLFWFGFLLQFVNIKIYLFGITALTGYVMPYYKSFLVVFLFALAIATIGTIATLAWVAFGTVFQNVYMKHFRIFNIIMALLLGECALSMVIQ